MRDMSNDSMLFGDPEPELVGEAGSVVLPVTDGQVVQLRAKLDGSGLTSMAERQALIEKLAGRPVASLRDLTMAEARVLLFAIPTASTGHSRRQGSAWDQREGDTWIDRL